MSNNIILHVIWSDDISEAIETIKETINGEMDIPDKTKVYLNSAIAGTLEGIDYQEIKI